MMAAFELVPTPAELVLAQPVKLSELAVKALSRMATVNDPNAALAFAILRQAVIDLGFQRRSEQRGKPYLDSGGVQITNPPDRWLYEGGRTVCDYLDLEHECVCDMLCQCGLLKPGRCG